MQAPARGWPLAQRRQPQARREDRLETMWIHCSADVRVAICAKSVERCRPLGEIPRVEEEA